MYAKSRPAKSGNLAGPNFFGGPFGMRDQTAARDSAAWDWPWCIAMSDNRPPSGSVAQPWQLTAAINALYARRHGYGFVYGQLSGKCLNGARARVHAWCKIPVVAHVLLHGVQGTPCAGVLYLDTDARDRLRTSTHTHARARATPHRHTGTHHTPARAQAHVANQALSIDAWLARARARGDEALLPQPGAAEEGRGAWQLLFASNFWFEPDGLNTGVWLARGGLARGQMGAQGGQPPRAESQPPGACGILRAWWEARFPTLDKRTPWEQGAMTSMHTYSRSRAQHQPYSPGPGQPELYIALALALYM